MALTSFQYSLIACELIALAYGCVLLCRSLNVPGFKSLPPACGRLVYWPVEGFEVVLLVALVLLVGAVCQLTLTQILGDAVKSSVDRKGLEVAVYGLAMHGGGLLAWPIFDLVRRRMFASYNSTPPTSLVPPPVRDRWSKVLFNGVVTLLMALPVVALVSLGWTSLLTLLGWPSAPQDLIATFHGTESRLVLVGMLLVACVLAPINEELLFRRGIYHFLRQRCGRFVALAMSASLFGLLHLNLAGFLPLATLGVMLALAYERTGDIRVPIVAHGLFNLNTILALLAGLSG